MLTIKDYKAIADILNRPNDPGITRHHIIQDMADYMAADNPRFDRQKFIDACYGGK